MYGNRIQVALTWDANGRPGVGFILPASTFIEMPDGEPMPGCVMPAALAREIAYALLLHAQQLDNGTMPAPDPRGSCG